MPKLEELFEEYDKLYDGGFILLPMVKAYNRMDKLEKRITKIRNKIEKLYIGDKSLA